MKYEAKNMILETLNIEWGQIDPTGKRRVKDTAHVRVTSYVDAFITFNAILFIATVKKTLSWISFHRGNTEEPLSGGRLFKVFAFQKTKVTRSHK